MKAWFRTTDLDIATKVRAYQNIYGLNLSFASIVTHCDALRECRILDRKTTHLFQSFTQELQAEINERLTDIIGSVESQDYFRFGKVRQAWEKQIRDPNDVFIQAKERRKELAKQHRRKKASKTKR